MQGGRLGDPSKMAATQYVSSNRQRQSMGRLLIYVYDDFDTPEVFPDKCTICIRRSANDPLA